MLAQGSGESENTFKTVFDNAPDGMLLTDIETRKFCMANNALCRELGYTQQEIVSLGVADIHPAEDLPYIVDQFEKQARREIVVATDIPVKRKDGSVFYADVSSAETVLSGRSHLMGIFRDVTDRKTKEEALRQSEEKFRLAMETTNDALWDWNTTTNEVYRNPRHATMLGYEPHELTAAQDEWETRIHPDDRQWVIKTVNEHLGGKTDYWQAEYRLRTKSGDYLWILGRGRVVARSSDGSPQRMIGTNIDITERKRTHEALEQSEQRYRELFENMNAGVAVYDAVDDGADFVFKDLNSAGQALDRIEREDVLGRRVTEVFPGITNLGLLEVLRRVYKTGNPELSPAALYQDSRLSVWRENRVYRLATDEVVAVYNDVTEQKKAEKQLRDSEEKYRSLFDSVPAGIGVSDLDGNVIDGNRAIEQMTGYTLEELRSRNVTDTYAHPEDREELMKALKEHGKVRDWEYRVRTKDGSIRYLLMNVDEVERDGRKILLMTSRDSTEARKAEKALQESEHKYRTLVTNIPDVIWTSDSEGSATFISPNVEEIYGYTQQEIYEQRHRLWLGQVHPDDLRRVERAYRALLEKNTRFDVEYRIQRKDGQWIWLHDRSIATYEKDGVKYADGIFTDITVNKVVDMALRESQRNLALAQQIAHVGSLERNLETGAVTWSDETYRLLGFKPGHVEPTFEFFLDTVHPQDIESVRSAWEKSAREGQPHNVEFRIIRADGVERVLDSILDVVRDSQGKPIRVLGVVQDITERRRSEQRQKLRFQILETLSQQASLADTCARILSLIRSHLKCDAAALRLMENDKYPYFAIDGFSQEFIEAENRILGHDCTGDCRKNSNGDPAYDCMCKIVLDAKFDRSKPFFTSKGTFWTNSLNSLLESTTAADRCGAACKTCSEHGYESVALIPIESDSHTMGLLQINARRQNFFSADQLQFLEELAFLIGVAVERKKAEQALQQSEEKFRRIAEQGFDVLLTADLDGTLTYVSPSARRVFGYSPDEMTGRNAAEFTLESSMSDIIPQLKELAEGKSLSGQEVAIRRKNGSAALIELNCAPIRDGQNVIGVQASARDITARRRMEKALRESEVKYRTLVESFGETIASIDENGVYRFINATGAKRLGGKPDDYIGKTLGEAFPEALAERQTAIVKKVLGDRSQENLIVELFWIGICT